MPLSRSPASPSLSQSLGGLARAVSAVCLAAVLMAFSGAAYFLLAPGEVGALFGLPAARIAPAADLDGVRLRLALALLPGLALFAVTVLNIRALFRRFARGRVLDPANGDRLAVIGWMLIAGAGLSVLSRTFIALALTLGNPAGEKQLVIGFSLSDFVFLLFGLFVLAFAHVIREAARLADENRGFI